MRILVMGSGGLGGYFGGLLQRAGEDVVFVARGAHLRALQADGLRVRSPDGDFSLSVRATDSPGTVGPVDLVLFTVKTYDLDAAGAAVQPAVGPQTAVLCLQNGVEAGARLGSILGQRPILGGVTYVSAVIEAPGAIRHTGQTGDITFGEMDGRSTPRVGAIDASLRRAGVVTTVSEDITRALWEKFVFISAMAGMTGATRASMGEIFEQAESRQMFRSLMEEAVAVGRSRGVGLEGAVDRHLAYVEERIRSDEYDMRASLYHDLAAGHRIELDALSGAVVRLGREAGVPTPLSAAIVALLRPYERRAAAAHAGSR
jgi:2-dehydropantoate 2-reductase